MYPAPFRYHRPSNLTGAIRLLSDIGKGARPLAGGQSLIPILKLRMDEPTDLVDIGRIPDLAHIRAEDGHVHIGALATHARIAASPLAARVPILRDCADGIADAQVRARGTIGGSMSTADPANDWPSMLHVLDAEIVCHGPAGERKLPIREFIRDSYTTALGNGELVTGIRFRTPIGRCGGAYVGFKKAAPAYPAAVVGMQLRMAEGDVCADVRLVLSAVGPRAVTSEEAESILRGSPLTRENLERAAETIIAAADPPSDARGSAEFKRAVLRSLFMKAAQIAQTRCSSEAQVSGSHDYV